MSSQSEARTDAGIFAQEIDSLYRDGEMAERTLVRIQTYALMSLANSAIEIADQLGAIERRLAGIETGLPFAGRGA